MVTEEQRRLLTLCALRVGKNGPDWHVLAREARRHNGLTNLWNGRVTETNTRAQETQRILQGLEQGVGQAESRVDDELRLADKVGARLVTVLDEGYPANLLLVHDAPPFLFIVGDVTDEDVRAVAVVGTRKASKEGLVRAQKMATALAEGSVTVASGLARGIDTAAHRAALDAHGRTLAVIGTGITRTYPAENKELAAEIVDKGGALVSQFWPSTPPASFTFPRRNATMSGISQGTVVIEASSTSGAKMQARLAHQHGKRVWLIRSLVTDQQWAAKYVEQGKAQQVVGPEDVLRDLAPADKVREASRATEQLAIDLA